MQSVVYDNPSIQQYAVSAINACKKVLMLLKHDKSHTSSKSAQLNQQIEVVTSIIRNVENPSCSFDHVAGAFRNLALVLCRRKMYKEALLFSKNAYKLYSQTTDHQRFFLSVKLFWFCHKMLSQRQSQNGQVPLASYSQFVSYNIEDCKRSIITTGTPSTSNQTPNTSSIHFHQQPHIMLEQLHHSIETLSEVIHLFHHVLESTKKADSAAAAQQQQQQSSSSVESVFDISLYILFLWGEYAFLMTKVVVSIHEIHNLGWLNANNPHVEDIMRIIFKTFQSTYTIISSVPFFQPFINDMCSRKPLPKNYTFDDFCRFIDFQPSSSSSSPAIPASSLSILSPQSYCTNVTTFFTSFAVSLHLYIIFHPLALCAMHSQLLLPTPLCSSSTQSPSKFQAIAASSFHTILYQDDPFISSTLSSSTMPPPSIHSVCTMLSNHPSSPSSCVHIIPQIVNIINSMSYSLYPTIIASHQQLVPHTFSFLQMVPIAVTYWFVLLVQPSLQIVPIQFTQQSAPSQQKKNQSSRRALRSQASTTVSTTTHLTRGEPLLIADISSSPLSLESLATNIWATFSSPLTFQTLPLIDLSSMLYCNQDYTTPSPKASQQGEQSFSLSQFTFARCIVFLLLQYANACLQPHILVSSLAIPLPHILYASFYYMVPTLQALDPNSFSEWSKANHSFAQHISCAYQPEALEMTTLQDQTTDSTSQYCLPPLCDATLSLFLLPNELIVHSAQFSMEHLPQSSFIDSPSSPSSLSLTQQYQLLVSQHSLLAAIQSIDVHIFRLVTSQPNLSIQSSLLTTSLLDSGHCHTMFLCASSTLSSSPFTPVSSRFLLRDDNNSESSSLSSSGALHAHNPFDWLIWQWVHSYATILIVHMPLFIAQYIKSPSTKSLPAITDDSATGSAPLSQHVSRLTQVLDRFLTLSSLLDQFDTISGLRKTKQLLLTASLHDLTIARILLLLLEIDQWDSVLGYFQTASDPQLFLQSIKAMPLIFIKDKAQRAFGFLSTIFSISRDFQFLSMPVLTPNDSDLSKASPDQPESIDLSDDHPEKTLISPEPDSETSSSSPTGVFIDFPSQDGFNVPLHMSHYSYVANITSCFPSLAKTVASIPTDHNMSYLSFSPLLPDTFQTPFFLSARSSSSSPSTPSTSSTATSLPSIITSRASTFSFPAFFDSSDDSASLSDHKLVFDPASSSQHISPMFISMGLFDQTHLTVTLPSLLLTTLTVLARYHSHINDQQNMLLYILQSLRLSSRYNHVGFYAQTLEQLQYYLLSQLSPNSSLNSSIKTMSWASLYYNAFFMHVIRCTFLSSSSLPALSTTANVPDVYDPIPLSQLATHPNQVSNQLSQLFLLHISPVAFQPFFSSQLSLLFAAVPSSSSLWSLWYPLYLSIFAIEGAILVPEVENSASAQLVALLQPSDSSQSLCQTAGLNFRLISTCRSLDLESHLDIVPERQFMFSEHDQNNHIILHPSPFDIVSQVSPSRPKSNKKLPPRQKQLSPQQAAPSHLIAATSPVLAYISSLLHDKSSPTDELVHTHHLQIRPIVDLSQFLFRSLSEQARIVSELCFERCVQFSFQGIDAAPLTVGGIDELSLLTYISVLSHMLSINQAMRLHTSSKLTLLSAASASQSPLGTIYSALLQANSYTDTMAILLGCSQHLSQIDDGDVLPPTQQVAFCALAQTLCDNFKLSSTSLVATPSRGTSLRHLLPDWLQITTVSIETNSLTISSLLPQSGTQLNSPIRPAMIASIPFFALPLQEAFFSSPTSPRLQFLASYLGQTLHNDDSISKISTLCGFPTFQNSQTSSFPTWNAWSSILSTWTFLLSVHSLIHHTAQFLSSEPHVGDQDDASKSISGQRTISPTTWWDASFSLEYANLSFLIHFERMIFGPFSGILRPPVTCSHAQRVVSQSITDFINKTARKSQTLTFFSIQSSSPVPKASRSRGRGVNASQMALFPAINHVSTLNTAMFSAHPFMSAMIHGFIHTIAFSPLYKHTTGVTWSISPEIVAEQVQSDLPYSPVLSPGPFSIIGALLYAFGIITTPFITLHHAFSILELIHHIQLECLQLSSDIVSNLSPDHQVAIFHHIFPFNPYSTISPLQQFEQLAGGDEIWEKYLNSLLDQVCVLTPLTITPDLSLGNTEVILNSSTIHPLHAQKHAELTTNNLSVDFFASECYLQQFDQASLATTATPKPKRATARSKSGGTKTDPTKFVPSFMSDAVFVDGIESLLSQAVANYVNIPRNEFVLDFIFQIFVDFQRLAVHTLDIYSSPQSCCGMNTILGTYPLTLLLPKELVTLPIESLPVLRWCDLTLPQYSFLTQQSSATPSTRRGSKRTATSTNLTPSSEAQTLEPSILEGPTQQHDILASDAHFLSVYHPFSRLRRSLIQICVLLQANSDIKSQLDDNNETAVHSFVAWPTSKFTINGCQHQRMSSKCIIKAQRCTRVVSLHHLYLVHALVSQKQDFPYHTQAIAASLENDSKYCSLGAICDLRLSFYHLDPNNELPATRKKLTSYFKEVLELKGEAGRPIAKEALYKALTMCHMYLYCGHNNGIQYYSLHDILQMVGLFSPPRSSSSTDLSSAIPPQIVSVMWLLGCSSVKLSTAFPPQKAFPPIVASTNSSTAANDTFFPQALSSPSSPSSSSSSSSPSSASSAASPAITLPLATILDQIMSPTLYEPTGTIASYISIGTPCIVGNLWTVIDKDLDKQTIIFCEQMFLVKYPSTSDKSPSKVTRSHSILQNIPLCHHNLESDDNKVDNATHPTRSKSKLPSHPLHSCDISSLITSARSACVLPYVSGSAIVIYGAHVRTDLPLTKSSSKHEK